MLEINNLFDFLSHASEAKPKMSKLSQCLKADDKAIRANQAILLCFSQLSVNKEGYIKREYEKVLDYQQEKLEKKAWLTPRVKSAEKNLSGLTAVSIKRFGG